MPINAQIPLQVERPRFMTPADMLSLRDLQTRAQANEFNLEQARAMAPLQQEQLRQQTESGRLKSLADIAKLQQDEQKAEDEQVIKWAQALVSANPQDRPALWKFIRAEGVKRGYKNIDGYPAPWDESMLPGFQAFVSGALKPEQALERGAYPAEPGAQSTAPATQQPPGVPLSEVPNFTGPQAVKIKPYSDVGLDMLQNLPAEEAGFHSQLATTGQAAVPTVGVIAKQPDETPDTIRAKARAKRALGGPENYKIADKLEDRADKLDDRIIKEQELEEKREARAAAKYQSLGDIGVTFNPKEGKYYKDGKEVSAKEVQRLSLELAKAKATNVNVGMTATDAAKAELLNQGISDIEEFKGIIMPNGEIDRNIVLGLATPGMAGVPGTDSRIAYSLIYNAIEAKLRAESGAAVPEQEVKRMAARFIPSPLDNDETIRSKIRRMEAFLRGSFGRIKNVGEPTTSESKTAPAQKPAADAAPKGVDQKVWDVMTPEEKKLWR